MDTTNSLSEMQSKMHALLRAGRHDEAFAYADKAEALQTQESRAFAAYARGVIHSERGSYPDALAHLRQSIELFQSVGDDLGVARSSSMVGKIHTMVGDYPSALMVFRSALDYFERVGEKHSMALTLTGIGHVLNGTGEHQKALEVFYRALALSTEAGDATSMAGTRLNISSALLYLGDVEGAHDELCVARDLFVEQGDVARIAMIDVNLSNTLITLGRPQEAESVLHRVEVKTVGDPEVRFTYHQSVAALRELSGDFEEAMLSFRKMLDLAESLGMRAHEARVHIQLRDLAKKRNDFDAYIEHNDAYVKINEEIKGAETARKMSLQDRQRELDVIARERERERSVLYSALPRSIADRVINGEIVNDHINEAGVMFFDIAGFTTLSSATPASDVVATLGEIFSRCDEICAQHGVTKIKTIGDSYMAFAPDQLSSLAAVAKDIRSSIFLWPDGTPSGTPVQLRIGLHVGPVVAGVLGTERLQYDVWGDTVNVASRMESTGEPGKIHVSQDVVDRLQHLPDTSFIFIERGEIDVKGKGRMRTYWMQ